MVITARSKQEINLLPKSEFEKSSIGRLLDWALTVGRYIVIFTEFVVIVCFLSRFKLDKDLERINKQIKEQQSIIISFEELENNVRYTQDRLKAIKTASDKNKKLAFLIQELTKIIPLDVIFTDLAVDQTKIQISGRALSNNGLNTFLVQLKNNKSFSKINLTQISSQGKTNPSFVFSIEANLE